MGLPVFCFSQSRMHAWPEYNYCAVDLFTCSIGKDLSPLIQKIKDALGADNFSVRKFDRTAEIESILPIKI